MNKMFLILAFTMLSIASISSVIGADQSYSELLDISNGNAVSSDSEVFKSGFSPFVTSENNIFKVLFGVLMFAVSIFISIFSIKCFANCKRV